MHPSFLFLLVVFRTAWVVTAAPNDGICYNIDQVQAVSSAGAPCDSEAEVSICCGFGSICLSNGLCETINSTQQSSFFTGDCTDSSWNSSTCPKICNNNKTSMPYLKDSVCIMNTTKSISIDPSDGTQLQACGNGDYCCIGLDSLGCCSTSSLVFSLGPANIQTTVGYASINTASTTSASRSTSSSVLSSSISSAPSEDLPSPTAAVIAPSSSARPSSNHVDVGVGIGIGVGIPVALALLAVLAYLIRRRSKISDDRDRISAYLDNKQELDANSKVVHKTSEIEEGSRTLELSEQGLMELHHPHEHTAVEMD